MMINTYIITFHWATNYGAVLQSYALQQYLMKYGGTVKIINYVPEGYSKSFMECLRARSIKGIIENFGAFYKEYKIEKFRKKNLDRTEKYVCSQQLKKAIWEKGIYICGSDQIWNPFFTMNGEGKAVGVYYLDFAPQNSMKIAYAASFGVTKINTDMQKFIIEKLKKINLLTVREKSGLNIIKEMGLNAKLVCDPVFLHNKLFYERMMGMSAQKVRHSFIFSYILHQKQEKAQQIVKMISKKMKIRVNKKKNMGIEEWLQNIYSASVVITNSFHAVAFSLIFNISFIAVLIEGSGMNDRILTLLEGVGLKDRAVLELNEKECEALLNTKINWEKINQQLLKMREESAQILDTIYLRR